MAGIALEVGIEPTARHAADLGFIPVLVQDAWTLSGLLRELEADSSIEGRSRLTAVRIRITRADRRAVRNLRHSS